MRYSEVNNLKAKEQDLLQRVKMKPELRPLFFRKVKGLKWFEALFEEGYFNAQNIPKPIPAAQADYVSIPQWEICDYLVKTVSELAGENVLKYAPRFLDIISNATTYAKENEFGNYHVWWQFSKIISEIPSQFIPLEFLDVVDYWLDDKFERGLVAERLGNKWFLKLVEEKNDHASELATRLLNVLYKTILVEKELGERKKREFLFRFDHYYAEKITNNIAFLAGRGLGMRAILVFRFKLEEMLSELDNDNWSSVWQPAIEEHDQNKNRKHPQNVIIKGYRESLRGFFEYHPEEAIEYIGEILQSPFQTIQRLAVFFIAERFTLCEKYIDRLFDKEFFTSNYRHELWHFLNRSYHFLTQKQKDQIIGLIKDKKRLDDNGKLIEGATAYEHATWLSAIKDAGEKEKNLYGEAVATAKAEPEHPDFSSYMSSGWISQKSPYSVDELSSLSIEELIRALSTYKGGHSWLEPGIEGLVKTVKDLIKASPSYFYADLLKFANLDLAYIYGVIGAYSELWTEKANLPWDDIWYYLLEFCLTVVRSDRFWSEENAQARDAFVANRYWIVGAIGRLLEAGAKADEHSFHEKYHNDVETLIAFLLKHEKGEEFKEDSDAVSIAINSPRGKCIEALINLTLRSCRLSDQKNNKDHSQIWEHFQHYYDAEMNRAAFGEYEFSTLVTNYLPNFLYMSRDWVKDNLERIFDQTNYLKWLCAMQGFSYVGTVYQEIFSFLSKHGDIIKVLDDKNIKDRVQERTIQHIVIAYLNDYEQLGYDSSLIRTLINRKIIGELKQIVWFIWTLRKEDENDNKLKGKVFELWPLLMTVLDCSTREGRELASSLCRWATFIDHLDEERKNLLLAIAPYADESHNSYDLLESIAHFSNKHPFEANELWLKMLEGSTPDYPEEAIRQILSNLIAQGTKGMVLARETVSEYIKQGVEKPAIWLRELTGTS